MGMSERSACGPDCEFCKAAATWDRTHCGWCFDELAAESDIENDEDECAVCRPLPVAAKRDRWRLRPAGIEVAR